MATEQVVEQVAEHLEEAAEVTRTVDPMFVKGLVVGAGLGLAVGFFWGWKWNKEKIRAELFAEGEEEIRKIREVYQEGYAARNKPDLEDVVEERGYSVVEERPLPAPVPVHEPAPVQHPQRRQDKGWNYETELPQRSKNHPYVIHQDEFNEKNNEYTQLTWTYYAADNILLDEHDEVVVRPELTVGEMNLKRFGHGSDDENVVFVRNDRIEIEWEICRTLKSYEVEVLGMDGPEGDTDNDEPA
jgi:hypothetical protein